ncbi:MAG: biosynthetic peptidoglycan transglycosylase [Myxococcota bacterium]|nr:biosynthetic peptidoglycan transglycosylase [Myxococcota bacterium]
MTRERLKRYLLPVVLAAVVVGGAALLVSNGVKARVAGEIAQEVERRLSDDLNAECRVGSAIIHSTREVLLRSVGCLFEEGPLLGIGVGEVEVHFERTPLSGPLPPIELFAATDVQLMLRDREALSALRGDDDSGENSEEDASTSLPEDSEEGPGDEEDMSLGLEREVLRFLDLTLALDEGRGGENVPSIVSRLSPGGTVRIERTAVESHNGRPLLSDLHARLERMDNGLSVAVAAQLGATGGLVAFEGTLTPEGIHGASIHLERVPVAQSLSRMTGTALEVADGVVTGNLSYRPTEEQGTWDLDLTLIGLLVHKSSIGQDWLPLPPIQLQGRLTPNPASGTLSLEDADWSVAETGGSITAELGPLGTDEKPRFAVALEASRLQLGRLLSSLPDSLMPASWAAELQGTMQIKVDFEGPLHERGKWVIDWKSDFSQMLLATGSLAQQVERLRGPFEHVYPVQKNGRVMMRRMGPADEDFVPISEVSRHLISAVVSTEDSGFFAHSGFEEESIKEAMLENLREGEGRGGSTITQQLAKNLFLSGERTFARKLKEAVIAWRLESDLPKERILEIYLNIAEWGPGIFGARDAARHYFDRRPDRLRAEQAAFLASLLPSPVRYHDYYHPNGLGSKRFRMVQRILHTMHTHGRLSGEEYHLARGAPVDMGPCDLD